MKVKVAVLGDIMLDRYFEADVKKSPEYDGNCVVNPRLIRQVPGGAGNVAMCLARMGIPTAIVGIHGSEEVDRIFDETQYLLNKTIMLPPALCRKDRYLHKEEILTRIDIDPDPEFFRQFDLISKYLIRELDCNIVITSDYNKGFLSEDVLSTLVGRFHTWIADPKKVFYDAYECEEIIVKPNSVEALDLTSTDNVLDAITKLAEWTEGRVVVTDGENPILFNDETIIGKVNVPRHRPRTVIGAGDVMTAVLAAGALEGWSLRKSLKKAIIACQKMMSQVPGNTLDKDSWNHIVTEVT